MSAPMPSTGSALPWDLVIAVTFVCVLGSGFFSGSETGLMSVSRVRLRRLDHRRLDRRRASLLRLLQRLEEPIMACLIGTNLTGVLASGVMTIALTARYGERGELWAVVLVSTLLILFGEIVPKILFREYPERLTLSAVPLLRICITILAPALWLLRGYTLLLQRLLPEAAQEDQGSLDRRSLASLLLAHTPASRQDRSFRDFMQRFLELASLDVRQIMRSFEQVVTVDDTATVADCLHTARRTGYSRLLVVAGDSGELVGWIRVRDLVLLRESDAGQGTLPPTVVRTCLYVDEQMSPYELFEELHGQSRQMAVVVDRKGSPQGLVTLEDLVETVVGSIQDEFDRRLPGEPLARTGL